MADKAGDGGAVTDEQLAKRLDQVGIWLARSEREIKNEIAEVKRKLDELLSLLQQR